MIVESAPEKVRFFVSCSLQMGSFGFSRCLMPHVRVLLNSSRTFHEGLAIGINFGRIKIEYLAIGILATSR
jgi:hypothetical protein